MPFDLIAALRLPLHGRASLRSFHGQPESVRLYIVDVEIGSVRLPDIEVVSAESGAECILGRNVLNKLRIVLDGPRQRIELRV